MQILPRRHAASQAQPDRLSARRPRPAHRLPDLPYSENGARRRRHHHRLGLEHPGKLNGAGYYEEEYTQGNGERRHTYWSIKGDFKWGENLTPTYKWFNGEMIYTLADTKVDASKPFTPINDPQGGWKDPKARIWPFKEMHTRMPYDAGNKTLVYNHLWGA